MSKNYSINEIAQILSVDRITVVRRIKDGSLKSYKQGNKRIIPEKDFNAFLEAHPKYSRKAKSHQSTQDTVVDVITVNEVFNVYVSVLKKLMEQKNDKETINSYVLPILENHRLMLDMSIDRLKKGE